MPSALQRISKISIQRHLIPDSLTHTGGTITAVVGSKTYSVFMPSLDANTLYFLYLRSNGASVVLEYRVTVPSAFRLVDPSAILVGAFYSSWKSTPDFGSFVTIEGTPTSQANVNCGSLVWGTHFLSTTLAAQPAMTLSSYEWWRKGKYFFAQIIQHMAAGASGAGTGNYRLGLPFAVHNDLAQYAVVNDTNESGATQVGQKSFMTGLGHISNGASRGNLQPFLYNSTSFWMIAEGVYGGYSSWQPGNFGLTSAQSIKMNLWDVPMAAFSETPLKDL